jgi:phosphoribosyl-ATP pyrophosphohydrolase/phosphoribosyl-AMP cyclohydrolase
MKLNFDKYSDGLIPAIVQDADSAQVLMLGFMNAEAIEETKRSGRVTFFSRSKKRLWTKGETSGNYLEHISITADCDADTLLIKAKPHGQICHTGSDTCFGETNLESNFAFLRELESVIAERRANPAEDSYVSSLFAKGINKIAQKVGEEAVEVVIAAKDDDEQAFKGEAADLLFHFLILLNAKGHTLADITAELATRKR